MRLKASFFIALAALLLCLAETSCRKDKFLTSGGELKYSLDTLTFDTVFTASGSFTAQVKLYNPQNQKVNISSVRLEGPDASFFHINVNGIKGSATNVELAANDSMYIFATVNIDPTNVNNPFVVNASIIATMNGKDYKLPLMAYGLNAYYIKDSILQTQTWKTDKPYVVIGYAIVDEKQTLTIPAGCRIYMNQDARLFVDGILKANGTKKDSIIFQGDRLDRKYYGNTGYPGEWGGIYFTGESRGNELTYVVLKNTGNSTRLGQSSTLPAAIQVTHDSTGGAVQLTMKNTIIENSIGYGLLSFGGTVVAQNCLINGAGADAVGVFQGGIYRFDNCTFVTYGNKKISHIEYPVMVLENFLKIGDDIVGLGDLDAVLNNCVIWGSMDNECHIEKAGTTVFNVKLNNCAIKQSEAFRSDVTVNNRLSTNDPKFIDYSTENFRLQDGSPLINAGTTDGLFFPIANDLDDKPRTGKPDVGCYER